MTKPELIDKLAEEAGTTKAQAERDLTALHSVITAALVAGDSVAIPGIGKFEVKERAERKGRNPSTGESVIIPASKAVTFKATKTLKDAVRG